MLAAVLLCGTMTVSAQKVECTKNGKTVKRIAFDRAKGVYVVKEGDKVRKTIKK